MPVINRNQSMKKVHGRSWCCWIVSGCALLVTKSSLSQAWIFPTTSCRSHQHQRRLCELERHPSSPVVPTERRRLLALSAETGSSDDQEVNLDDIKRELTEYLEKRKAVNADEAAKESLGKTIGGTKGNKVLEYVSLQPNKPTEVKELPEPFDYDELTKYGYGHLVTPIMKAGGRLAMYKLMGMDPPAPKARPKAVSAPKLVIDRTGENDEARYSGLKLGQVLDDEMQAAALAEAQKKVKEGKELRPKLQEEFYEQPFADKRNVGPKQTPLYTPEMLDEIGRQAGQAAAWAERAKKGEYVSDPLETLDLDLAQRVYSITAALLTATAFGQSTPTFLTSFMGLDPSMISVLDALQAPALGLLAASVGSMAYCTWQSSDKNRNPAIWAVKGLLGGPLTIAQLRGSQNLVTRGEQQQQQQ